MRKFLTLLLDMVFVVNYAIGSVAFVAFLGWYDTGRWDGGDAEYSVVAISGFIIGCVALAVEMGLVRRAKFSPPNLIPFLLRFMATSVLYVALSFAICFSWIMLATTTDFTKALSGLLVVLFMTAYYLLMMVPFGAVVGLINGVLFRLARTLQK